MRTSEVDPGSPLSYSDMSSVTGSHAGDARSSVRPGVNEEGGAMRPNFPTSGATTLFGQGAETDTSVEPGNQVIFKALYMLYPIYN